MYVVWVVTVHVQYRIESGTSIASNIRNSVLDFSVYSSISLLSTWDQLTPLLNRLSHGLSKLILSRVTPILMTVVSGKMVGTQIAYLDPTAKLSIILCAPCVHTLVLLNWNMVGCMVDFSRCGGVLAKMWWSSSYVLGPYKVYAMACQTRLFPSAYEEKKIFVDATPKQLGFTIPAVGNFAVKLCCKKRPQSMRRKHSLPPLQSA